MSEEIKNDPAEVGTKVHETLEAAIEKGLQSGIGNGPSNIIKNDIEKGSIKEGNDKEVVRTKIDDVINTLSIVKDSTSKFDTKDSQKIPTSDQLETQGPTISAASVPVSIKLTFGGDGDGLVRIITLPIKTFTTSKGTCKSICNIMPMGEEVLIAEYGMIGMMELLQGSKTMQVAGYMAIVGTGDMVDPTYELGMNFMPKSVEAFALRHTFDPQNQYSFEKLHSIAKKEPGLLAAVTIAGRKDESRVGLRMESQFIDPNVIKKMEQYNAKKGMGPILYKDAKLEFINYKMMHVSNIGALVITDE